MASTPRDFSIEDDSAVWADLALPQKQLSMVRTYIYLKTRLLFDPPATSLLIEAMNKKIQEFEWRLGVFREELIPLPQPAVVVYE